MIPQHHLPADIERTSMQIIAKELEERHIRIPRENLAVVKRVIHTTADFEYAETLHFTENAVQKAIEALHNGATIITDTNMALAGVSKPGLKKLNGEALCFMADPAVAQSAKESGTTRAVAAMHKAEKEYPVCHCRGDRKRATPRARHRRAGRLCERHREQRNHFRRVRKASCPRHRCIWTQGRQHRSRRRLQCAHIFRS